MVREVFLTTSLGCRHLLPLHRSLLSRQQGSILQQGGGSDQEGPQMPRAARGQQQDYCIRRRDGEQVEESTADCVGTSSGWLIRWRYNITNAEQVIPSPRSSGLRTLVDPFLRARTTK